LATNATDRRIARCSYRLDPLAPIRVAGRRNVAGRRALAAAVNPTGPTVALVQTREGGGRGIRAITAGTSPLADCGARTTRAESW